MKLILQDSNHVTRSEFYGKNLAELGVPLSDALSPPKSPTHVSFQGKMYTLG